jgi:hypothetical protein
MLESMVEGRRVAAPPPLVDAFGEALAPFADAREPSPARAEAQGSLF